jgi:hypothetical protein
LITAFSLFQENGTYIPIRNTGRTRVIDPEAGGDPSCHPGGRGVDPPPLSPVRPPCSLLRICAILPEPSEKPKDALRRRLAPFYYLIRTGNHCLIRKKPAQPDRDLQESKKMAGNSSNRYPAFFYHPEIKKKLL